MAQHEIVVPFQFFFLTLLTHQELHLQNPLGALRKAKYMAIMRFNRCFPLLLRKRLSCLLLCIVSRVHGLVECWGWGGEEFSCSLVPAAKESKTLASVQSIRSNCRVLCRLVRSINTYGRTDLICLKSAIGLNATSVYDYVS